MGFQKVIKIVISTVLILLLLFSVSFSSFASYDDLPENLFPLPDFPISTDNFFITYSSSSNRYRLWIFSVERTASFSGNYLVLSGVASNSVYYYTYVDGVGWGDYTLTSNPLNISPSSVVFSTVNILSNYNNQIVVFAEELPDELPSIITDERFTNESENYNGLEATAEAGLYNTIISYLKSIDEKINNGFDEMLDFISRIPYDFYDLLYNYIQEIYNFTLDLWVTVTSNFDMALSSVFDGFTTQFEEFKQELFEKLDYYFNPNSEQLEGDFNTTVHESINSKFSFADDLVNQFNLLSANGRVINIQSDVRIGNMTVPVKFNFDWYENYRASIRSGIGVIFNILCALACFRALSSVLHVGVGKGVGGIYQSVEPNSQPLTEHSLTRTNSDGSVYQESWQTGGGKR